MKTGLITSDTYQNHNTGDGHPEKIDRVTAVIDNFKKLDNKNLIWKKPNKFENSFLIKTHTSNYIDQVNKSFPKKGYNFLDGDTIVSPGSKDASKDAVGSIITAIDGVQKNEFKNAFCAVRPPGHHAEKEKAMGFCIYNNVAVGASINIIKSQLLILMFTMEMELKTFFMITKKFYLFLLINTLIIQDLALKKKKVILITY